MSTSNDDTDGDDVTTMTSRHVESKHGHVAAAAAAIIKRSPWDNNIMRAQPGQ